MEEKKFELTENYIVNELGTKLCQIKCTKTFKYAKEGELGGYIEKEENSQVYRLSGMGRIFCGLQRCYICFNVSGRWHE